MSLKQPFSLSMLVVLHSLDEVDVIEVQGELQQRIPGITFSPAREQPSLEGCLEFHASAKVSVALKDELTRTLDNDFDSDEGMYWAYGFNTKMFDPRVYYLQLEFMKNRMAD